MTMMDELRRHEAKIKAMVWENQDRHGKPRSEFKPLVPVSRDQYIRGTSRVQHLDGRWYTDRDFLKSGKLRKGAYCPTTADLLAAYDRSTAAGYICTTWGWFAPEAKQREWERARATG